MPAISRMRSFVVLPIMLVLMLLGGIFAQASFAPKADALTRTQAISGGVGVAAKQVGDPYSYGSAGPDRFDCSGLIYFSYRAAGISVPRTSGDQARYARRISKAWLKKGDLMFFADSSGHVYHAGIFIGRKTDGRVVMLHSPRSGRDVTYAVPWTSRWFAATLRA